MPRRRGTESSKKLSGRTVGRNPLPAPKNSAEDGFLDGDEQRDSNFRIAHVITIFGGYGSSDVDAT
jgi:hypothetical protein